MSEVGSTAVIDRHAAPRAGSRLRMADLALHSYVPPLARVTAAGLKPFAWLDEHVPAVRRHGYLLASVGVRRAKNSPPE
jgi:hypothetical protein